jgi:uncharacterized protein
MAAHSWACPHLQGSRVPVDAAPFRFRGPRCSKMFGSALHLRGHCVLAALLASLPTITAAQDKAPDRAPVLTIRGVGKHETKPDFARLAVDVTTVADSLEKPAKASGASDACLRDVSAREGRWDRHGALVVQPEPGSALPSRSEQNQPAPPKFRAVTSFTLKSRQLDNRHHTLRRDRPREVRSVRYGVDNDRQALDKARRAAVADAREQAELYADAAKVSLVEIIEIDNGRGECGVRQGRSADAALCPSHSAVGRGLQFRSDDHVADTIAAEPLTGLSFPSGGVTTSSAQRVLVCRFQEPQRS